MHRVGRFQQSIDSSPINHRLHRYEPDKNIDRLGGARFVVTGLRIGVLTTDCTDTNRMEGIRDQKTDVRNQRSEIRDQRSAIKTGGARFVVPGLRIGKLTTDRWN